MSRRHENSSQKPPPPKTDRARVLLVDHHPVVRRGMAQLIDGEPDLVACGEAEDRRGALLAIRKLKPHLVIIDVSLSRGNGLALIKEVRLQLPGLPVLVVSTFDENFYAERVLRAGAQGYIMKQEPTDRLLLAIRRVLSGQYYLNEKLQTQFLRVFLGGQGAPSSPYAALSDRELEVFRLLGQGQGTRQLARNLNLSVKTVETHLARVKRKLKLRSATALLQQATLWVGQANQGP